MTVFSALKSNCHRSGYFVHTSYDVYTIYIADSVPFGEGLSVNITNMKHYLFIAIIIAETKQRFYYHSVSTHRIRVYRKRYK